MIDPEAIDLNSLPWLPLEEKAAFPKKSAIYFAIDSLGTVQYIGRSINVRQRWGSHHKYDELASIGNIKIAYLFIDSVKLLAEIEAALINWFDPLLNAQFAYSKSTTNETANYDERVICKLKALMDAQELSQLELREKTGLATSTIGRLYRNQVTRIDIETVETLMKHFGLTSISQLIEVKP